MQLIIFMADNVSITGNFSRNNSVSVQSTFGSCMVPSSCRKLTSLLTPALRTNRSWFLVEQKDTVSGANGNFDLHFLNDSVFGSSTSPPRFL